MPMPRRPRRHGDAEGAIDGRLLGQEATDPLAGFIEGAGRRRDVAPADEANEAIPEIFALDEEEDDQHQDDPRPRERLDHRRQGALDALQRGGLGGNHADRPGALIGRHLLVEVANGAVDALRKTAEAAPLAPPQGEHLALDGSRVLGHLDGQTDDLALEEVTERGDRGQRDDDDHGHRPDAAERAFEEANGRTEREGDHDRQRQRNEDGLRAREDGDDQDDRRRACPGPVAWRRTQGAPRGLGELRSRGVTVSGEPGGPPGTR